MKFDGLTVKELYAPTLVNVFKDSKLIINSTPIGMYPESDDAVTTMEESFVKDQIVFDLVYNPLKTKLLQIAEKKGAIILDGLNMLVYQAAGAFKLWTGEELPIDKLHKSLQLYINSAQFLNTSLFQNITSILYFLTIISNTPTVFFCSLGLLSVNNISRLTALGK